MLIDMHMAFAGNLLRICSKDCDMDISTLIQDMGEFQSNHLYIKRDDLIPYSFGGNKARKGKLFFEEIDRGGYDCVVTYGSSHSNHCRIIANMAAARNMKCYIISPLEVSDITFNSRFMELFGAEMMAVPIDEVHDTIENKLQALRVDGKNIYFIPGGGHGNLGTEAYVQCYHEIKVYEQEQGIQFDYIFFASGTGTTQAGLVCGQLINDDRRKIIGISIARKNPRGCDIVIESIRDYLAAKKKNISEKSIRQATVFLDDYTGDGYGKDNKAVISTIKDVMVRYGIPLDSTYTGKAFYGMKRYLEDGEIRNKKVLFIHTGGTPLFFDVLRGL